MTVVVVAELVMVEVTLHWYSVLSHGEPQRDSEPIGQQPALVMSSGLTMHLVRICVSEHLVGGYVTCGAIDDEHCIVVIVRGTYS